MRSLVAAIALAATVALATGCASPVPRATAVTPTASPLTAEPTEAPTLLPTMAAFSHPYPAPEGGDPNWAVVASWDGSGNPGHGISQGQAEAGAIIDVAFACEQATQITIHAIDASTGDPVVNMSAPCRPGQIGKGTFTPDGKRMTVNFDAVNADPQVHFWVKLAVPDDQYLP